VRGAGLGVIVGPDAVGIFDEGSSEEDPGKPLYIFSNHLSLSTLRIKLPHTRSGHNTHDWVAGSDFAPFQEYPSLRRRGRSTATQGKHHSFL